MGPTKLLFITGNANKLLEVRAILEAAGIQLDSQSLDIPELQGTTDEVARSKCKMAAEMVKGPCIVEDTSLSFKALGGLPGVYIKHFMQTLGHDGLNKLLVGFDTNEATAICTFAYSSGPGAEPVLFVGENQGRIVPARGPTIFGWDAIFQPDGFDQTYAEMDKDIKNGISHRGKALDKLKKYFEDLNASSG